MWRSPCASDRKPVTRRSSETTGRAPGLPGFRPRRSGRGGARPPSSSCSPLPHTGPRGRRGRPGRGRPSARPGRLRCSRVSRGFPNGPSLLPDEKGAARSDLVSHSKPSSASARGQTWGLLGSHARALCPARGRDPSSRWPAVMERETRPPPRTRGQGPRPAAGPSLPNLPGPHEARRRPGTGRSPQAGPESKAGTGDHGFCVLPGRA